MINVQQAKTIGRDSLPPPNNIMFQVNRKEKKNRRRAIQREFEHVGPIMLKNSLGARWGLLPTLHWVGFKSTLDIKFIPLVLKIDWASQGLQHKGSRDNVILDLQLQILMWFLLMPCTPTSLNCSMNLTNSMSFFLYKI